MKSNPSETKKTTAFTTDARVFGGKQSASNLQQSRVCPTANIGTERSEENREHVGHTMRHVKPFSIEYPSVITALATPFYDNGKIDVNSYVKLCKYQQENGVDALLALGTTAEAQLLSDCEKKLLVTLARKTNALPLIVGIEEPSTIKAVREAKTYAELGADALLIAPPSFCKCTPEGYIKHIEQIASASKLPIVLYNIPARASYSLDVEAVKRLIELGYVKYVKDSSLNMDFAHSISPYSNILCGSDESLAEYVESGAVGVVSVVSNVAPCITKRALQGEKEAQTVFGSLAKLATSEINPIAIKYMLYKAGIFTDYQMRLPLTRANEQTRNKIDEVWKELK